GDPNRFQGPELLQVLDSKYVESLSGHYNTDDEGDADCNAKVHRDTGVPQVVKDAVPPKLIAGPRTQARLILDSSGQRQGTDPRLGLNHYEGRWGGLRANEVHRLAVASVHDGVTGERRRRIGNPDDGGLVIV